MSRRSSVRRTVWLTAAMVFLAGNVASAQRPPSIAVAQTWSLSPSPSPGVTNELNGVAAASGGHAWAVGDAYDGTAWRTLILRWNGSAWTAVASPNHDAGATEQDNYLTAVTTTSTGGAWAVGFYFDGTTERTLTLRWNGSVWTKVASPNVDPGGTERSNRLNGVSAGSAGSVWAVGTFSTATSTGTHLRTLILHWNGTSWTHQPSPNPAASDPTWTTTYLSGVSATSSTRAWAVGGWWNGTKDRTLALHWNGTKWKTVASPNGASMGSTRDSYLKGVTTRVGIAWAVGNFYDDHLHAYQTLTMRWNGTTWKKVPSPNFSIHTDAEFNYLLGVAMTSANDVWAAGWYGNVGQTLILHWNGTAWKRQTTPNPGNDGVTLRENELAAVAAIPGAGAWAVGHFNDSTGWKSLALRCC